MKHLSEPLELDLFDFPWQQQPLTPINPDLACIPHGYQPSHRTPDDMSVIERRLYDVDPLHHEWRKTYFHNMPHYLAKYFANRYIQLFQNNGRRVANTFLREKMQPAAERMHTVLRQYKNLPNHHKVILLSEDYEPAEQSDFVHPELNQEQAHLDLEESPKSTKTLDGRILAELELDEVKDMAFRISKIVLAYQQHLAEKYQALEDLDKKVLLAYEDMAKFVTEHFGIKAPRKRKKQTPTYALNDISRMLDDKWWFNCLSRCRKIMREHLAIAMGQVSSKASPYASWDCIREHQEQQKRNWEYIKQQELFDEETEETIPLEDMVVRSVSNPAIRRHELMVRCRGCEDIGNELGLQGLFLTLTTPAKYHNSYKKGGFIGHWNGASPRDAQTYLNKVWQRIRAKLGREKIRWFGVRVAEPHHDGTPHWHLLIWVKPEDKEAVTEIFVDYATKEDKHELFDKQGRFDYSPRCDVGEIDPEKGTATGYIAKYISKNIDGYAMDDEVSDETGQSVKGMAKNVSAWKSRWNIRQFQFFGGAPVTTYRELRRFANQNKKAFMEYLFMQERTDLLTIYSMLQRNLVGPIKPSKLITNEELMKVIGDSYQPSMKTDDSSVTDTLKAADIGNWQGYVMGQGGPFVKREDLLIVNSYEVLPFASPHGEDVRKIEGVTTPEATIKTRTKVWTIQKKQSTESDAIASGSEATFIGSSAASRSSVNNCTELRDGQVSDQLNRLFAPNHSKGSLPPNIDDSALNALLKGSSVRVDKDASIQIRPAYVDEHGHRRPAQLVEVTRQTSSNTNWMEFESWDQVFAKPEQTQDEYQQPDLSIFPELESDWPMV